MNFDGASTPLSGRLQTAKEWVELARALGTNITQVPSSFEKSSTGDGSIIVKELQALAEIGSEGSPPVSRAYEALSRGHHVALFG
ncbi:hypothetical protein F5884DRAFT_805781 [Xylogone sp. PMI_703]|nr:hypothetical protein F5884DRAFT_805781 [Xylogone sp. PMI_703]